MSRTLASTVLMDSPRTETAEASALAAIVRSSRDAVIAKTLDGTVTAWNGGATVVYGYSAAEMLGQSIEKTIPSDSIDEERARHARVATGMAESGYRCRRIRADGRPVEVVMSMSPVRDDQGRVIGVASISRPVSEAEHSAAMFASLLEAAPDAIVCVDPGGRIVVANTQATALFGYDAETLVGADLEMLLPDDVRARHIRQRTAYARDPKVRTMGSELSLFARRHDGTTFPVEVSLAPGGDHLVIAAIRDVTEQRALAAVSHENEARLRQIAESVNLSFVLLNLEGPEYLYTSHGAIDLMDQLGSDPHLTPSETPLSRIHPDDRERVDRDYVVPSRAGRPASSEHRIVTGSGDVIWIKATATPVTNPEGPVTRTVLTVEDISDRVLAAVALQEAEAAARAANNAKNEFLSRMSHELRTPLNAVLGFGQLLEHRLENPDDRQSARHVVQAGRHLLELINEVLDISRIEAGEVSVSLESISVEDVVGEAIALMQPLADGARVRIVSVGGPAGCAVQADRQRVRQILLNLLSNAVKYNREGGMVALSWTVEEPGAISLSVRDDGPGIAPELHGRLFTPFDRLGAEASGIEGTGVGLTVTRSLVDLMNGTLSFQSEPGTGTCFTVTLTSAELHPTVLAGAADATRSSSAQARNAGLADAAMATLLYVDDNEPNIRVMESVVKLRREWRFIHAGLASLGIELATAHQPDLIFLDVHLPDGNGADVLEALKSDSRTSHIPVVVLSADVSEQRIKRLIEAGALRYLTKPVDLNEVLEVLDAISAGTPPA